MSNQATLGNGCVTRISPYAAASSFFRSRGYVIGDIIGCQGGGNEWGMSLLHGPKRMPQTPVRRFFGLKGQRIRRLCIGKLNFRTKGWEFNIYGSQHFDTLSRLAAELANQTNVHITATLSDPREHYEYIIGWDGDQ
jgi:hypothetical protein